MRVNQPGVDLNSRRYGRRSKLTSLWTCLFFVLVCVVCVVSSTASPVVPNGDFEQVQIACPAASPFRECVSVDQAMIPGWTHTGTSGEGWIWQVGYSDADGSISTAGNAMQFVTLGGGEFAAGFASWTTTVTGLNSGSDYLLSFMIASEGGNASLGLTATLSNGATATGNFSAPVSSGNYWRDWVPETLQFTAAGTSATLVFSTNTLQDIGLDDVSVNGLMPMPEPGTLTLLGLGLLAVIAGRRKTLL